MSLNKSNTINKYNRYKVIFYLLGIICVLISNVGLYISTQQKEKHISALKIAANSHPVTSIILPNIVSSDDSIPYYRQLLQKEVLSNKKIDFLNDSITYYKKLFLKEQGNQNDKRLKILSSRLMINGTVDSLLYQLNGKIVIDTIDKMAFFLYSDKSYFKFYKEKDMNQIKKILSQ
jgi:hypothetical protein